MQDSATFDLRRTAADMGRYICRADDGLWVGIERALDNGYGAVFVTDAAGVMTGTAGLDRMRAAVRKGAHLGFARLGDVAVKWDPADASATLVPILDDDRRIVDVKVRAEAAFLPVAEPDLSHLELRNLIDAYLSTWISSIGDYVRSFEHDFAHRVGTEQGVATSNGTVSLHLALAALRIGEGDEVIVPDFTFAASANTVIHVGARPVLTDVDPDTWCLSVETIEKAITPRTKAIMPVHVFGRPAPMTEIMALAKARELYVIEDCAEAHGASYDGKPIGSFGDIGSFSFFGNKIITTGEGGMCVTNNAELAARMRMLRDHGMRPDRRYWHDEPGFNFRMTNVQAAIGCAQLARMDELLATRRNVGALYETALANIRGVSLPPAMSTRNEPVVWFACALTPAEKRTALISACREANIDMRPFFHGLSSMPAYRDFARTCPVSSHLAMTGVNLPTSRKVDERLAGKIGGIFRRVLES
jgi:perosamine synthetase